MSVHGDGRPAPAAPTSLWVLAMTSLVAQLTYLARNGLRADDALYIVLSMALGSLIVGWFSVGVMRAGMVRLVIVGIVLALAALFELVGVFAAEDLGGTAWNALQLALSAVQIGALARYCGSDWFAWHRARPPREARPALGGLLVIAVVVGAIGGLVQQVDQSASVDLRIGTVE